jgi:hypothetical protein
MEVRHPARMPELRVKWPEETQAASGFPPSHDARCRCGPTERCAPHGDPSQFSPDAAFGVMTRTRPGTAAG